MRVKCRNCSNTTMFFLLQRLQEAETRNQELSQSVTSASRPLLRQIENLQASLGGQTATWEKLEKNISDRLGKRQSYVCETISKPLLCTVLVNVLFALLLYSRRTGPAGCCCGEGACGNRRTTVHQIPAGISGVPEFLAPPGKSQMSGTTGG